MKRRKTRRAMRRDREEGEQGNEQGEQSRAGEVEQGQQAASQQVEQGQQAEQGQQGEQLDHARSPTTQYERAGELSEVIDSSVQAFNKLRDVEELEYAAALESGISYYERLDRLYGGAMARREGALRELDLYRQGLGHRLRQVSDEIIDGEFSETEQESPPITGPGDGGQ